MFLQYVDIPRNNYLTEKTSNRNINVVILRPDININ